MQTMWQPHEGLVLEVAAIGWMVEYSNSVSIQPLATFSVKASFSLQKSHIGTTVNPHLPTYLKVGTAGKKS